MIIDTSFDSGTFDGFGKAYFGQLIRIPFCDRCSADNYAKDGGRERSETCAVTLSIA